MNSKIYMQNAKLHIKNKNSQGEIFSVQIPDNKKDYIFTKVRNVLNSKPGKPFVIATLNPEILLKAENDSEYACVLNNADLKIIDGIGIKLLSFLKGKKTGDRMAGADLAEFIISVAKKKNLKTLVVIREDGLSTKSEVEKYFCKIGYENFFIKSLCLKEAVKEMTEMESHDIMLVGLGAPFQELFIAKNLTLIKNLKLAVGVGGTFDYWTGKKIRAPLFFRKIGLEWLWRSAIQPNRIRRIWNAVVIFPYKVFKNNGQQRL